MPPQDADSLITGLGSQQALRLVRSEGFFAEVFNSLSGPTFVTGLALWFGADEVTLGLLVALPFIAQAGQLAGPLLENRLQSRRRFVVPAFALGRLLWLVPVLLLARGGRGGMALHWLGIAALAMTVIGSAGNNGWTSWMADVVTPTQRGRVFGARTAAVTIATMTLVPLGSLWLDKMRESGREPLGHAVLAAVAAVCGCIAGLTLLRLPDAAPIPVPERDPVSLTRRLLRRRRFRRVVALFSLWNVSIGMPAAFWTVYMLKHLHMSFFLIGVHASIILGVRVFCTGHWSRLIDTVGSQRVLVGSSFGAAIIPLLWFLPSPGAIWPIWIEAVISGFFWTGFGQAAFIQPIAALASDERSRGLAFYNVLTGSAMFVASVVGGKIVNVSGMDAIHSFYALFGVTTAIRLFTSMLALRMTEPGVEMHKFLFSFYGSGMLGATGSGAPSSPEAGAAPAQARRRDRNR